MGHWSIKKFQFLLDPLFFPRFLEQILKAEETQALEW